MDRMRVWKKKPRNISKIPLFLLNSPLKTNPGLIILISTLKDLEKNSFAEWESFTPACQRATAVLLVRRGSQPGLSWCWCSGGFEISWSDGSLDRAGGGQDFSLLALPPGDHLSFAVGQVSQTSVHSLGLITSSGLELGPVGGGGTSTTFASTRATLRQVQRRGERGDKNVSFSEDCQYLNTYIDGISVIFREDFNLGKPESVEYRGRGGHCNIGQLSNYCGEINKCGYIISVLFNTYWYPPSAKHCQLFLSGSLFPVSTCKRKPLGDCYESPVSYLPLVWRQWWWWCCLIR